MEPLGYSSPDPLAALWEWYRKRREEEMRAAGALETPPGSSEVVFEDTGPSFMDLARQAPYRFIGAPVQDVFSYPIRKAHEAIRERTPFPMPPAAEPAAPRAREEFERAGQEYLAGGTGSVGSAVGRVAAKTGLELAGYATQGALTAPVAGATARFLPGAGRAAMGAKAAIAGALENSAWEALEGGNVGIAAAVGAVMAGIPALRGSSKRLAEQIETRTGKPAEAIRRELARQETTPEPPGAPGAGAIPEPPPAPPTTRELRPDEIVSLEATRRALELAEIRRKGGGLTASDRARIHRQAEEAYNASKSQWPTTLEGMAGIDKSTIGAEPPSAPRPTPPGPPRALPPVPPETPRRFVGGDQGLELEYRSEVAAGRQSQTGPIERQAPSRPEPAPERPPEPPAAPAAKKPTVGQQISRGLDELYRRRQEENQSAAAPEHDPLVGPPPPSIVKLPGRIRQLFGDTPKQAFERGVADARKGVDNSGQVAHPSLAEQAEPMLRAYREGQASVQTKIGKTPGNQPPGKGAPKKIVYGNPHQVGAGNLVLEGRLALVEADEVIPSHDMDLNPNPAYRLTDMQNRRRDAQSRRDSELTITQHMADYQPQRLMPAFEAQTGTPIMRPTGELVTGNGRWVTYRRLAADPKHPNHGAYRAELERELAAHGFDSRAHEGFERPLLVTVADAPEGDLVRFAADANARTTAAHRTEETALLDASRLSQQTLSDYVPNEQGDVASPANRDFIRGFAHDVVRTEEQGEFFGPHGELTNKGRARVEAALFAKAYKDPDLIQSIFEATESNIKNIGRALKVMAPRMAKLELLIEGGARHPLSISDDIYQAAAKIAELRTRGEKVADYLDQSRIAPEITQEAEQILRIFDEHARAPNRIASTLDRYGELVDQAGDPNQGGLFGGEGPPDKLALLQKAREEWTHANARDLFAGGATADPHLGLVGGPAAVDPIPGLKLPDPGSVLSWARRWLTTYGDFSEMGPEIGGIVAESKRLARARVRAHAEDVHHLLMDFGHALKAELRGYRKAGVARTEQDVLEYILDGVQTRNFDFASIGEPLRRATVALRDKLDGLSGRALTELDLSKEMRKTIEENLGVYLHRLFAVHRDPESWKAFVKNEEPWRWNNMKEWLREQRPEWSESRIEGEMNGFIDKYPEAFAALGDRGGVDLKNFGVFTRRIRNYYVRSTDVNTGEPVERIFTKKGLADEWAEKLRGRGIKATVTEEGLPKEFDDFLGLEMDPRVRLGTSIMKIAQHLETNRFLTEVAEAGYGRIFFREPTGEFSVKVPGGRRRSPLDELYTRPDIAKVIEGMRLGENVVPHFQFGIITDINSLWRAGKTVGHVQGHARNTYSWAPMLWVNGKFLPGSGIARSFTEGRGSRIADAAKIVASGRVAKGSWVERTMNTIADHLETVGAQRLSDVFRFDLDFLRQQRREGIALGIYDEGARAGEFSYDASRLATLAKKLRIPDFDNPMHPGRWLKKAGKEMAWAYREEDNFGKDLAWAAEIADYAWAYGKDVNNPDDLRFLRELTAPIVRNTTPTYSKVPPGTRFLRDLPVVADFPSFWSERYRQMKEIPKQAIRELKDPNPRVKLIGARRMSGWMLTVTAMPAGVAAWVHAYSGATEEDVAAAREFGPHWNRHSDLAIPLKLRPGKYRVYDISYSNPDAVFREIGNALLNENLEWDERLKGALLVAGEAFASESMIAKATLDTLRNTDDRGFPVYDRGADPQRVAVQIAKHFGISMAPGTVLSAKRIWHAWHGTPDERGHTYNLHDELVALGSPHQMLYGMAPGARIIDVDVERAMTRFSYEIRDQRSSLSRQWNAIKRRTDLSPQRKLELQAGLQDTWENWYGDLQRKIRVAREAKVPEWKIRGAIAEAEVFSQAKGHLGAAMAGRPVPIFAP